MSGPNDWNAKIIKEFRENGGHVPSYFVDAKLLLLHTQGAKSGQPRINPLVSMEDGDRLFIMASGGGSPKHPAWYHNLVANPVVEVEYGLDKFKARAIVAEEPERTNLYNRAAATFDFFREYVGKTKGIRIIPVVILERLSS